MVFVRLWQWAAPFQGQLVPRREVRVTPLRVAFGTTG
jgi:hypothetical protein